MNKPSYEDREVHEHDSMLAKIADEGSTRLVRLSPVLVDLNKGPNYDPSRTVAAVAVDGTETGITQSRIEVSNVLPPDSIKWEPASAVYALRRVEREGNLASGEVISDTVRLVVEPPSQEV